MAAALPPPALLGLPLELAAALPALEGFLEFVELPFGLEADGLEFEFAFDFGEVFRELTRLLPMPPGPLFEEGIDMAG